MEDIHARVRRRMLALMQGEVPTVEDSELLREAGDAALAAWQQLANYAEVLAAARRRRIAELETELPTVGSTEQKGST